MPGYFNSPEGDLESIFIDDYSMIDQYAMTGSLWGWGQNYPGLLGDNTSTMRSSPIQTISAGQSWKNVSCGSAYTAAIKTDGTLWLWGTGTSGQLGDNTTSSKSSPVQTISQGNNWKLLSCGSSSTAAIKTDGTLWLWGDNSYGQLGDNTTSSKSSPVQTIFQGNNWKSLSCGSGNTLAIKTDGTLWAWGKNNYFQLGFNSSFTNRSSPVQTAVGGTNWKTVSCGSTHVAAIKTDNTLWMWGSNNFGELGDGTRTQVSTPTQTVGATQWKFVSLSKNTTMTAAIKLDGSLWVWGTNSYGQLGINNTNNQSSPIQTVSGGTNWKSVVAGTHVLAVKTDGTLWTWGNGTSGQLGDNTSTRKSSPVQTISGGTNWKLVASGNSHSSAIYFYDAAALYPNA